MIETKVDVVGNLAIHSCHGLVRIEKIKSRIGIASKGEATSHTIWNFSDADLAEITKDDILELSGSLNTIPCRNQGKKIAIVTPDELCWGLARMYQSLDENAEQACSVELVSDPSDPEDWIGQD